MFNKGFFIRLAVYIALAYVAVAGGMYVLQGQMVFNIPRANEQAPQAYPTTLQPQTFTMEDGTQLVVHISKSKSNAPMLLTFGGNAQNSVLLGNYLAKTLPDWKIASVTYRGYGQSGGKPSAQKLLEDGTALYDQLKARYQPNELAVLGISLGSGVATYVAAHRPVDGLLLALPYDQLSLVAQDAYPWLPARWLFTNNIPSIEWAPDVQAATGIILAENDYIVRPARSAALRKVLPHVKLVTTVPDVGHVALLSDPSLGRWLKKATKEVVGAPPKG